MSAERETPSAPPLANFRNVSGLLRPSELARHLSVHPKTVTEWIRSGRLLAIRTPGNQFRLSADDVRAFCEREGVPVPTFAAAASRSLVYVGSTAPLTLRGARYRDVSLTAAPSLFHALYACLREPPFALLIEGLPRDLRDFADTLRTAFATPVGGRTDRVPPIYLYDAPARRRGVLPLGIAGVFSPEERDELGKTVRSQLRSGR